MLLYFLVKSSSLFNLLLIFNEIQLQDRFQVEILEVYGMTVLRLHSMFIQSHEMQDLKNFHVDLPQQFLSARKIESFDSMKGSREHQCTDQQYLKILFSGQKLKPQQFKRLRESLDGLRNGSRDPPYWRRKWRRAVVKHR